MNLNLAILDFSIYTAKTVSFQQHKHKSPQIPDFTSPTPHFGFCKTVDEPFYV